MKRPSFARIWPTTIGVLGVAGGVAAIDGDVREYIAGFFDGRVTSQLATIEWQVSDTARFVIQTVRDQSFEHGPLMMFTVAAGVLLLFMLRT